MLTNLFFFLHGKNTVQGLVHNGVTSVFFKVDYEFKNYFVREKNIWSVKERHLIFFSQTSFN